MTDLEIRIQIEEMRAVLRKQAEQQGWTEVLKVLDNAQKKLDQSKFGLPNENR